MKIRYRHKFNFKLIKLSKTFKNLIFVDNVELWITMLWIIGLSLSELKST